MYENVHFHLEANHHYWIVPQSDPKYHRVYRPFSYYAQSILPKKEEKSTVQDICSSCYGLNYHTLVVEHD